MTVFEAFPKAILSGVWVLHEKTINTITGKAYSGSGTALDVIIDEETEAFHGQAPEADYSEAETLIYAKPEQFPTTKPAALQAGYLIVDSDDNVYDIRKVGLGKNQETGELEHVEIWLRPTEANDGE